MKRLTTYISHMKDFHSLNEYLNEKLVVNKNYKYYVYAPKSWNELRKIIEDRYDRLGAGTEENPIDFNDVDVSKIDSFNAGYKGIFARTKFEYIDVSDWNVSGIKDMRYIFYNCENLESIGDLSEWDVSSVKNAAEMFSGCHNLKSIGDLSNWDVSNVKDMNNMFYECRNLKSVGDLSGWDVSIVDTFDMYNMFYGSGITNIPSWYKE